MYTHFFLMKLLLLLSVFGALSFPIIECESIYNAILECTHWTSTSPIDNSSEKITQSHTRMLKNRIKYLRQRIAELKNWRLEILPFEIRTGIIHLQSMLQKEMDYHEDNLYYTPGSSTLVSNIPVSLSNVSSEGLSIYRQRQILGGKIKEHTNIIENLRDPVLPLPDMGRCFGRLFTVHQIKMHMIEMQRLKANLKLLQRS